MNLWERFKDLCSRARRAIARQFRNPDIDLLAGAQAGASIGRCVVYAYSALILIMVGAPIAATYCVVAIGIDLFISFHVFRYLGELMFRRGTAQPTEAVGVVIPNHPATATGVA